MDNMKNEQETDLIELTKDIGIKELSPEEEYKKVIKKSKGKLFLFLLIEIMLGVLLCILIVSENLNYRVIKQIKNTLSGQIRFETGTYYGETDFGYFTGDGVFDFASGTEYNGQWSNNEMEGLGVLNIPSEGVYKGGFSGSLKNGEGTFTWNDGAVYEGEWENDFMHGQGIYTSPEKVKYTGTFVNNLFYEGTCDFVNETGSYTVTYKNFELDNMVILFADGTQYSGSSDGKTLCGPGRMKFSNDDYYAGKFENGMRNGLGVYVWSTGDQYNGDWLDDAMNGSGTYTFADGGSAQGEFEKNQFIKGSYKVINRFGEYTFHIEDNKIKWAKMVLSSGTTYSGDVKDGKLTGTAQITYSNGDKYSGQVVEGCKSGQGTYVWASGASYEGNWENDKMNGKGTYFYSEKETGYKLTGNFEKGAPNGKCWYYTNSSESYKTDWLNGKCVKMYE